MCSHKCGQCELCVHFSLTKWCFSGRARTALGMPWVRRELQLQFHWSAGCSGTSPCCLTESESSCCCCSHRWATEQPVEPGVCWTTECNWGRVQSSRPLSSPLQVAWSEDDERSLTSLLKFTVCKASLFVPNNKFHWKQINLNFVGRIMQDLSHSLDKRKILQ